MVMSYDKTVDGVLCGVYYLMKQLQLSSYSVLLERYANLNGFIIMNLERYYLGMSKLFTLPQAIYLREVGNTNKHFSKQFYVNSE